MSVEDFKARARTTWASGDFPRIARETVHEVGPALVEAVGLWTGAKVLDVAAGTGAASVPAALAGGDVVASDLTPELLEVGRHAAIAGFVGQMFMTMAPYMPPLPEGALPPILWGDEDHVRRLFGDGVSEIAFERRVQPVTHLQTADELVDYYRANLGPMITTFKALEDDPERTAELDAELRDLARRTGGDGYWAFEYLQIIARRAA